MAWDDEERFGDWVTRLLKIFPHIPSERKSEIFTQCLDATDQPIPEPEEAE